jgi:hypothetical protein
MVMLSCLSFVNSKPYAPRDAREQIDQRIDYILARPGRVGERVLVERAFR